MVNKIFDTVLQRIENFTDIDIFLSRKIIVSIFPYLSSFNYDYVSNIESIYSFLTDDIIFFLLIGFIVLSLIFLNGIFLTLKIYKIDKFYVIKHLTFLILSILFFFNYYYFLNTVLILFLKTNSPYIVGSLVLPWNYSFCMFLESHTFILLLLFFVLLAFTSIGTSFTFNKIENIYFIILLTSLMGSIGIFILKDVLFLYLMIELMTISFYFLIALNKTVFSVESAIKYFIIGSLSGFLFLYSVFFFYLCFGTFDFQILYYLINSSESILRDSNFLFLNTYFQKGIFLFLISFSIKVGIAPFHAWFVDVYEGANTPTTILLIILSKLPLYFLIITIIYNFFLNFLEYIQLLLLIFSCLSVFYGSIGALNQTNVKRLLLFSSIADSGFLYLGISTGTFFGIESTFVYLILYLMVSLSLWLIVLMFEEKSTNKYFISLNDFSNFHKIYGIFILITISSLAGIPPFVGFWSKWAVLSSAMYSKYFLIFSFFIIASMVSTFYYLQFIKLFFFEKTKKKILFVKENLSEKLKIESFLFLIFLISTFSINPEIIFIIARSLVLSIL
jgi:proton-translocating NADH-quinone oxidoreductase chain N